MVCKKVIVVVPVKGGSRLIAEDAVDAFVELGYDTECFDTGFYFNKNFNGNNLDSVLEFINQTLLEKIKSITPDLVLILALAPVRKKYLEQYKKYSKKTALWWVEDFKLFDLWQNLVKNVDCTFVIQPDEFLQVLTHNGYKAYYLPTGVNPKVEFDLNKERIHDVSFIGSPYKNRIGIFEQMAKENVPVSIWGGGWEKKDLSRELSVCIKEPKGWLSAMQVADVLRETKIGLNLHSSPYKEHGINISGDFLNRWVFTIPACGALQLVDRRPLITRFFKEDEEVICYSTIQELKEKINYYLSNHKEAQEIIKRAKEIVLKEHLCTNRIKEMLSVL